MNYQVWERGKLWRDGVGKRTRKGEPLHSSHRAESHKNTTHIGRSLYPQRTGTKHKSTLPKFWNMDFGGQFTLVVSKVKSMIFSTENSHRVGLNMGLPVAQW